EGIMRATKKDSRRAIVLVDKLDHHSQVNVWVSQIRYRLNRCFCELSNYWQVFDEFRQVITVPGEVRLFTQPKYHGDSIWTLKQLRLKSAVFIFHSHLSNWIHVITALGIPPTGAGWVIHIYGTRCPINLRNAKAYRIGGRIADDFERVGIEFEGVPK